MHVLVLACWFWKLFRMNVQTQIPEISTHKEREVPREGAAIIDLVVGEVGLGIE
jgi:hypothetical protein